MTDVINTDETPDFYLERKGNILEITPKNPSGDTPARPVHLFLFNKADAMAKIDAHQEIHASKEAWDEAQQQLPKRFRMEYPH